MRARLFTLLLLAAPAAAQEAGNAAERPPVLALIGVALIALGVIGLLFIRGHRKNGLKATLGGLILLAIAAAMFEPPAATMPAQTALTAAEPQQASETAQPPGPEEPIAAPEASTSSDDVIYGAHCMSLWDGSHDRFVEAVKARLNDPDSFVHDDTRTWRVRSDGRNQILMNFRADNALGGTIRVRASGTFDNETCGDIQIDFIE